MLVFHNLERAYICVEKQTLLDLKIPCPSLMALIALSKWSLNFVVFFYFFWIL